MRNFVKTKLAMKLYPALVALLLCSSLQAQNIIHTQRYASDNQKAEMGKVVLMGDSITDFWVNEHPSFFTDNGLIGRGISGEETAQMLLRFRSDVLALAPSTVVILAGINDIGQNLGDPYSEDNTLANIQSMTELARLHGARVILCSVLPSSHFPWRPEIADIPAKVAALNARIRAYAQANGLVYLDYYNAMVGPDGFTIRDGVTYDTVHPTSEGYELMETLLLSVL